MLPYRLLPLIVLQQACTDTAGTSVHEEKLQTL